MIIHGILSIITVCLVLLVGSTDVRSRRQIDNDKLSCTLPPHPKNGLWTLMVGKGKTNETISLNDVLQFQCNKGYKLSSENPYLFCDNDWNSSTVPQCEKLCPPMYSTFTTILKCVNKDKRISCLEATEGSHLSYTCASFYEAPSEYQTIITCSNGKWNSTQPICQPVCGKKIVGEVVPLVRKETLKENVEYPWVAAIYRKKNNEYVNICGGSLLNERIVLTAADCVTKEYGDPLPKEDYQVAAGKLYSDYNDTRDSAAQYLDVSRIVIHPNYKRSNTSSLADVAILVTKVPFILNKSVQPICFDNLNNIKLQDRKLGVVVSWAIKRGYIPPDKLKTLEIPYKNEVNCVEKLQQNWTTNYNMEDKLCVGFDNKSIFSCRYNSGSGLFFKNPDDSRYYIHGFASPVVIDEDQCEKQQNLVYTKTATYYEFVKSELSRAKACILPTHPENGRWVVENNDKNVGDVVPADTVLKIECNQGYRVPSENSSIECGDAPFGMPSCQKMCPDLDLNEVFHITCKNKEGDVISCSEAVDYTTMSYKCPRGYKIPDGIKNTIQCLNGSWEMPTPECQLLNNDIIKVAKEPMKVVCFYDSRRYYSGVKPEDFNATLCTHIVYHYAGLSYSGNLIVKDVTFDTKGNKSLYESVVAMKSRNSNLKILLSVYGLGINDGDEFPNVSADPAKRAKFVASAVSLLETYKFDGLDVHWHSPTSMVKENYTILLEETKEALKRLGKLLTITVYYTPIYSGYSTLQLNQIVDWIHVKCYEFYNEFDQYTGQNSALYASSVENDFQENNLNVKSCIANWRGYGTYRGKLIPTVTFFGRYYTLRSASEHNVHAPVTGSTNRNHTGLVSYAEICQNYTNWTRVWDKEQKTPYKYYQDKWVGYDDEESIGLKAAFIKSKKYPGIAIFSIDGDDIHGKCGVKQALLKQVHKGISDD